MNVAIVGYAFKRVIRSWRLFIALLLGVILASSFFAGINISVDSIGVRSLNQQLSQIYVDMVVSSQFSKISSDNVTRIVNLLSGVEEVKSVEVISRTSSIPKVLSVKVRTRNGTDISFRPFVDSLVGVSENSYIYNQMVVESGSPSLGENETYIEIDSEIASRVDVGDNITLQIPVMVGFKRYIVKWNLTVAGFVSVDDRSFLMSLGRYGVPIFSPLATFGVRRFSHNILILDWNKTFSRLMDEVYSYSPTLTPIIVNVMLYLDRESLINPWDTEGSKAQLDTVTAQVENILKVSFIDLKLSTLNYLSLVMDAYEVFSMYMTLQGVILALPVFFVAWYMGLTVSKISFHLRRREIGLLLTKGFTSGQLLRIFMMEAVFIGMMGAAAGLTLGAVLTPIFTMGQFTEAPIIQPDTIIIVTVFSIVIALLAVFKPARKASRMKAVETLREYLHVEEEAHRKVWLWIALILGTYKIVMLLLGLDLASILSPEGGLVTPLIRGRGGGFLFNLLRQTAIFTDNILTYLGPILFFWSFTRISIGSSVRFQRVLGRLTHSFIKDLSVLAEKNVQRNSARVASITFLLAIIVGYSVSAIGQIASQQDYTSRLIYASVGADINVIPSSIENLTQVIDSIKANITEVESVTVEYMGFSGESAFDIVKLTAINPKEWLSTAYYEPEWFNGGDPKQLLDSLSNDTIILENKFSQYISIGENISLTIGGETFNLKVIGFYGPEASTLDTLSSRRRMRAGQSLHSYINLSLYERVNETVSATPRILVKLKPDADGGEVAERIREIPSVEWVNSAAEQLRFRDENLLISGPLNVLKLGVFFAAIAASIGVALVTLVTMQERRKEITLLMVRGFSIKQVILVLLTENLGTLLISGILGVSVGYLIDRGNIAASNVTSMLVAPRVIFPPEALLILTVIFSFIIAAAVLPVIIMVFSYSSKLVWRT